MEKTKTRKMEDLYFGIRRYNFNTGKLEINNLFASLRVLRSIATYRAMSNLERSQINDALSFCFGDTRWHVEYEFLVQELFSKSDSDWEKVDTWTMYVEPNADYLMSLVNSISRKEAKEWIKEYDDARKRQLDSLAGSGSNTHNPKAV